MPSIGLVILAAGASTRLGSPKQLLPFGKGNLLGQAVNAAVGSSCRPIILVLGAHAEQIRPHVLHPSVHVLVNEKWHEGMISSIRAGINFLIELNPAIDACVFMTCDQPFVSANTIEQIVHKYHLGKSPIVACEYSGTLGVPTLFDFGLFAELLHVPTGLGAKAVLAKHAQEIARVPFPEGAIDIDTPGDYAKIADNQSFT